MSSLNDFLKPFQKFKDSSIIDVSTKSNYLTYDDFYQRIIMVSNELSMAKLTPKSIIVIFKLNNPFDSILVFFACLKNDLIPFIVEMEEIKDLSDFKYKAIVTNGIVPSINSSPVTLNSLTDTFVYDLDCVDYFKGNENDFIIVTSSKSTSAQSKKILLGVRETLFNIRSNRASLPILENDRTLILLPFSYSYGLIAQFLTHLFVGADIVIAPRIVGVIQLKSIIQDFNISNIFLTPLLARLILIYNTTFLKNNLRFLTLGGDKPCQSTISGIRNLFNCEIYGTYGLAEAGPRVATSKLNLGNEKIDLGQINPGIRVEIVESEKYKEITKQETVGYLKIYTPSIYLGYIQGNHLCEPVSSDFLMTKDVVYHSGGNYYLLGRDDEYIIINSRTYWFQEFKSFFYKNHDILKVKIQKELNDKLLLTIFYKNRHGVKFDMEELFDSHFGLKKDFNYSLTVVGYQHNQYK